MALGLQLCAGVVILTANLSCRVSHSHSSQESPTMKTMWKWGEEVLLVGAIIAIAVLVMTF